MKHLKKVVGINLLVLLAYSIVIRIINGGGGSHNEAGLGILLLSAFAIGLHVLVSLIISLGYYSKNKDLGKAWLLTTGIVLLVGFSSCWGNAML